MKIDINVTETLSRTITVYSKSIEEAISIVEDMYKNEEIILDESDFNGNVVIEENNINSKKDLLTNEIIQYLIEDEKRHYEELDMPNEHIYLTLLKLKEYLI